MKKKLLLCFSISLAALFTLASASGAEDRFLYALDADGTAWSFAVAVNMSNRTLVFTSSNGAENYADGEAQVDIGGSMSKLYVEEGKVFDGGELFSWRTEKPVKNSLVFEHAQPALGETISVHYLGEEQARMSMTTTVSQFKVYEEDGTAIFSLAESVPDLRYIPGYALNDAGQCVGVLYKSGIAYAPWYQADAEGGQDAESSNPGTDLDDDDETDPWWKTTAGLSAIAVGIALVGIGIVIARNKRKTSGGNPPPVDSGTAPGANAQANVTETFSAGVAFSPEQTPNDVGQTAYRPPAFDAPLNPAVPPTMPAEPSAYGLEFTEGALKGAVVPLGAGEITVGRDFSCSVRYPADYTKISRKHALIRLENGQIVLRDTSSRGIFRKGSHEKLPANQPIPVRVGEAFYLGGSADCMEIVSL